MKAGRPIATRRAVAGAGALLIAAALQVTALPSSAAMSPAEMIGRAWAMRRSEPAQARQYAEQALAVLAERPDADLQVYAHLLLSWSSIELANDLASARRHAARARALLPAVKRRGFAAGVLVCEGGILQATGAHTQALALYEQAVVAAEGDVEAQALALYMRGRVRGVFLGEIALGLADLRRSMTLLERLGSRAHAIAPADALYTIARLYSRMGDHAQALRYHEEELRARPPEMVTSRFFTLLRIGHAQLEQGNRAASRRAFNEALALARDIDGGKLQPGPLLGLAMLANARGAPGDALQLLERATAHASEAQWRLEILRERGVALRLLRRPAQSVAVLRAALRGFQQAKVAVDTSRTHGELAQALADLGDWRGAFEQYKRFKATSDDLLERQLDQRFALQKVEFDTASKERENAALKREMAATDVARRQEQRASRLQAAVLALAATLAGVLATQAWRARRASVRKLRESEERFQVAVAGSNHGIWDWDLKSDMLFLSERAQLMMGLEPTEPLQRRRDWLARIRYHPDDAASVRSALSAHLRRSTPLFDAEYRLLHADGRWVWHRQRGVAVRDAQGRPCRVAGSIEDTTPRHEAEAERSRLEAQLRRAQKLEAIGTLAGGIAHDFNNILAAILGHGEMAQRAVPEGSAQRRLGSTPSRAYGPSRVVSASCCRTRRCRG